LIDASWNVEFRSSANSASDLETRFVVLSRALFGDRGSPSPAPDEKLASQLNAEALIAKLAEAGLDFHNVGLSPYRDQLELLVEPRSLAKFVGQNQPLEGLGLGDWARIVILVPADRPKLAQATSETRVSAASSARSGKQLLKDGSDKCSTGPMVRNTNTNAVYVMTAGHCLDSNFPNWQLGWTTGGVTLNYVVNSRCNYCVWGVDAVLLQSPTVSNQFIWQEAGWYNNGQQQGQSYLDTIIGTQPSASGMNWTCLEGASGWKYPGWYTIDARSSCGLAQVRTGNGFRQVELYDLNLVCGGDSGGLVRRPTGYGGSWVLGLLSARNGAESIYHPPQDCSQRYPFQPGGAAFFYYSEWSSVRDRMNSFLGMNLEVVQ
jgi:hypothetical protein